MEIDKKYQILDAVDNIYEMSNKSELDLSLFELLNEDLQQLATFLKIAPNEAFFVAIIFNMNYEGETVDFKDLITYFNCRPSAVLRYNDVLEALEEKNVILKTSSRHRVYVSKNNNQYFLNKEITEAILSNTPLKEMPKKIEMDVFFLLETLYKLGLKRSEGEMSTGKLLLDTKILLIRYSHFPLVKKTNEFQLNALESLLYFYVIHKTIVNETAYLTTALEAFLENSKAKMDFIISLTNEESILIKENLLKVEGDKLISDATLELTDESLRILENVGVKIKLQNENSKNLIIANQIPERKLFYKNEVKEQISMLSSILEEAPFNSIKDRLKQKNMPQGVTVLLHGSPGTGKTETVLQLAKETNRAIFKIDISNTKSMWFGESEKKIKRIFTDYKALVKKSETTPILFFNEADAIISTRKNVTSSNVAQTENAIQNIILDELETFDGIFMATTNLIENLDNAFERRFLFKIKLQNPEVEQKMEIWKQKLPLLTNDEALKLADSFDFSGGQIDNIARKVEIHEIIHNEKITLQSIESFCQSEKLDTSKASKVGFGR